MGVVHENLRPIHVSDVSVHARQGTNKRRMQKSSSGPLASSPSASRLLPRRWRTKKAKKGNSAPTWKPEGGCVWANSVSGRRLTLSPVSLVRLSEAERVVLKKLALARLQALQLGCSITVPKDCSKPRSKSRGFSLKRRTASGGLLDNLTGKENSSGSGRVFGIPLAHCIHNERQKLSVGKHPSGSARRESLSGMGLRKSSSSSGGAISSDSFSDVTDPLRGHQGNHSLLDALSLSSSATLEAARTAREYGVSQHNPHVPQVVRQCCQHIQAHGLQTLGIFRIGCSKKRTKQLREEYDAGGAVELGEEYSPHDIGGLLKEYFRDLPDPLLTRDLYTAWVATRKLASAPARVSALQQLVCLLPAAHRDTLAALLHFLNTVAQHSTDSIDTHGQLLEGNKMGAHNLATLFGPNILHKSKGGEFRVESAERAEERGDVIAVVQELIEYHDDIFTLSRECHDEVLQTLQESNTEAVDILLKQKSASLRIDVDHETSSLYGGESDSSSLPPHTPSSLPGDQPGTQAPPRNLTEALASVTPLQHGPSATESSLRSDPATTPAPPRAAVADTQVSGSFSETLQVPAKHRLSTPDRASSTTGDKLQVPASYRLSAPEPPAWYNQHSTGRSLSPGASPRVSPAPKAMRSEIVIDPNSKITQARMLLTPKTNRRSMVETVTIEAPQSPNPSPADSSANMSARAQWFLDTPPSTPTGVPLHTVFDFANPLKRTSSTHRPLGVPTGNNNQTANLNDSNRPADESTNQKRMSQSGDQSSNHRHSQNLGKNLANTSQTNKAFAFLPNRSFDLIGNDSQEINSPHYVTNQRPESMPYDWQKERWKHWESMAKSHNDELVEQETLV